MYLDLNEGVGLGMSDSLGLGRLNGQQVASRSERILQAALLPKGHPERRELLASLLKTGLDPVEEGEQEPLGEAECANLLLQAQGELGVVLRTLRILEGQPETELLVRVMILALEGFEREVTEFRATVFEPAVL